MTRRWPWTWPSPCWRGAESIPIISRGGSRRAFGGAEGTVEGAATVLRRIRRGEAWQVAADAVYPGGSYGNGAAMRAPVLALFYARDRSELVAAARDSAKVTHAHPLGVEGAVLIALATHALQELRGSSEVLNRVESHCSAPEILAKLKLVREWIEEDRNPRPLEVARRLGNGTTVESSCATALYISLRHLDLPFEEMIEFILSCRGDTDTIGAMAGALWGVANGAERIPKVRLEARKALEEVALQLFRRNVATWDAPQ